MINYISHKNKKIKINKGEYMTHFTNQLKYKIVTTILLVLLINTLLIAQSQDLLQRRISITAIESSFSSVLTELAHLGGINIGIVSDPNVSGPENEQTINVTLNNVSVELALSSIVRLAGLSYRFVGENTFLVGPRDRIREEVGERSYIIELNHLQAESIQNSFDSFGGSVTAIEGQNALMVYANPETYSEIMQRINQLDVPQKQIEIRARLIEVSINDSKKIGVDWSRLNRLTTILAENPRNAEGVGLPWNYSDVTGALPHGDLYDFGKLPATQYFQKIDGFNDVGRFSRQLNAFDITLDWLLENNAAHLLTDATVTSRSGVSADIFIGEVIPFVSWDRENEFVVEREEVGIKLTILPTVNKDGFITVTVSPEASNVIGLIDGRLPRTRKRTLNTQVTVPNGQKIYAGTLVSSDLIVTTNKVPFLGDIPFIGGLFRHKVTTVQNTDLVIEITPRIINLAEEQYDFDIDNRLGRRLLQRKDADENGNNGV
jgi:hypothetical protein